MDNSLRHDGAHLGSYPRLSNQPKYNGESLTMIINRDKNVVYFESEDQNLGVAFTNLPPVRLYPAICAVYGNSEASMVYHIPPSG